MSRVRKYKKIETIFVRKVQHIANNLWLRTKDNVLSFFRAGSKKLTIMVVPHSQKNIISFHTSIFSLVFGAILLVTVSGSFFWLTHKTIVTGQTVAQLRKETEVAQASLYKTRKELKELLKNGQKFHETLSTTLSSLGLDDSATPLTESTTAGDLSALLGMNKGEDNTATNSDVKKLSSYLVNSIEPVEKIGSLLESQTTLFSDIPSIWPIKGGIGYLTFRFGQNRHPISGRWYLHTGIDISTQRSGDPIIATADGQVVTVDLDPGWGNYVIIKHKHGFYTRYAHMQSYRVTRGQHVQQGQVIGYIGNTGLSTGPHLHYEVHIGSDVVDPLKYLNNPLSRKQK